MTLTALNAISPVDGRYRKQTEILSKYFSESALIRYRLLVEAEYFLALCYTVPQLKGMTNEQLNAVRDKVYRNFQESDAIAIKETEKTTNHDVKAVEYFVKEKLQELGMEKFSEFVHFGLTSQDINNTATPLLLKDAHEHVIYPALKEVIMLLITLADQWKDVSMLAHTHGQPASPTRLGKEIQVFIARLQEQVRLLHMVPYNGKFGGATGNFNAHHVAYPDIDWKKFGDEFVQSLGLVRSHPTTQIEHYDNLAAYFDGIKRINTILIDLCRDMWTYISMNYFKQKTKAGEIGSSAMPHKVNPIDFENAEGNLGIANAILEHLSAKLPISRLQRDLTDSTVLRNVGVPMAHTLISFNSICKGLTKLVLNEEAIKRDLDENWAVVAEAIQTVLRREGYPKPYEALKDLTRGNNSITKESIATFIDGLKVDKKVKEELKKITPESYTGI